MVHTACAARWQLTRLEWTSTVVRNQNLTRIQLSFFWQADFGFQFSEGMSERMAISPHVPINPSDRAIREEMNNRSARKRNSSATETVVPSKKRRGTQTEVAGHHIDSLARKLLYDYMKYQVDYF